MADYDALTYHRLIARYNGIVADTTGPQGDPGSTPDLYTVNMVATVAFGIARDGKLVTGPPELRLAAATPPRTLLLVPIRANVESGVLRLPGADVDGVDLIATSAIIGLAEGEDLIATVTFGDTTIGGSSYKFDAVRYVVPTVAPEAYAANRIQTVTLTGGTGGQWALVYGGGPTAFLPPTATAVAVQTALRTVVPTPLGVSVAGDDGGPYTVAFDPVLIPRPYPLGAIDNLTPQVAAVRIVDQYQPVVVDLTTVPRWTPVP